MNPLSDLDAAILDFEETAPRSIGRKEEAIRAQPTQPCNQEGMGLGGRGGVEKQIKALVIAHRGDIQLRTNSLFFAADTARRGFLEVQNGGV